MQKEKEQYHYCLFSNYRAVHTECDTIQKFKMLMKRGVLNGILNNKKRFKITKISLFYRRRSISSTGAFQ